MAAFLFDRYSNTLLVSLNNRISIRDIYGARGGAVDCEDVAGPAPSISNNSRPESTTETMITETEKPQEDIMRQLKPVPEAVIEEWVIGKSCSNVPYFLQVTSSSFETRVCRHRAMLIV
jgi:hypothetical protein